MNTEQKAELFRYQHFNANDFEGRKIDEFLFQLIAEIIIQAYSEGAQQNQMNKEEIEKIAEQQSFFERIIKECLAPEIVANIRNDVEPGLLQITFRATARSITEREALMQENNPQLKELILVRIRTLKEHINNRLNLAISRLEKYEDKK